MKIIEKILQAVLHFILACILLLPKKILLPILSFFGSILKKSANAICKSIAGTMLALWRWKKR